MISRFRRIFSRNRESTQNRDLRFSRPLVVFQSDDWGRVGIRDREGWLELQASGMKLGEKPYDFYSLETSEDLHSLLGVLKRHHDAARRHPSVGMNFVMANIDFSRAPAEHTREIPMRSLVDGLPEPWQRPMLIESYREGIRDRVFSPALHGLTHFCAPAVAKEFGDTGERRQLLNTLWRAGTPYIHWRMPWIGYEYWDPGQLPAQRFLTLPDQRTAIHRAGEIYRAMFASIPLSACAPGYRANQDTKTAWFEAGVRVVQGGPGARRHPCLDEKGMLLTFRNVEMEPATSSCDLNSIVKQVGDCFEHGMPAIISMHSINFHSTIKDFRTPTLALLDDVLSTIEKRWPEVLYVHDDDLWNIATQGFLLGDAEKISVRVTTA